MSFGRHTHIEAQLMLAVSGAMQVRTDAGQWLLPPQLAFWVPASVPHGITALSDTEIWSVYYQDRACRRVIAGDALLSPFVLRVVPLLRELLRGLFAADLAAEKAHLIAQLLLHELTEVPNAPTFLPLPTSSIGRRVADLALADRQCRLNLPELAEAGATSSRTVSRIFVRETGLPFKTWRQRARIVGAMERLALDATVAAVAADAGYASTAAFAFAFRQVTGCTVTAFMAPST